MNIAQTITNSRALVQAIVDTVVIHRDLKSKSFATICSDLASTDAQEDATAASSLIEQLCEASDRAGRLIPRSTCLTRSLALQRSLQRHAINSQLCIGADSGQDSFGAHAWIEINGVPVNSAPSVEQGFRFRFVPDSVLKVADTADVGFGITRHD